MRAILFDCDGTIADSCGLICDIMGRVFNARGLDVPPDAATRAIIGLSLDVAIARLHPTADPDIVVAMAESYRSEFHAARRLPDFAELLFDGMKDLVLDLSRRENVLIGMVTGKSRRGVAAICEANGLAGAFVTVRTADDCPSKPHPAMVEECCAELGIHCRDALVVGDSIHDMRMARAAGASGLAVAWGTHNPEELLASGAFAVADSVPDLALAIDDWLALPADVETLRYGASSAR